MKKPGWIIVIGVIGIIIGFFGVLGTGKLIIMPRVIEFQKEILAELEDLSEEDWWDYEELPPERILKLAARLLELPDWFYTLSIIFGIIGFFVYAYYLFASIWLILTKKSAVQLFYIAIALSMCLSFSRTIAASLTKSIIGFFFMAGSSFLLAVNIILLIVVAVSDKSVFKMSKA